jgi:hypothetical protein
MTRPQKLGLAAAVIFAISHCLPAYGDGLGFACFQLCWSMLFGQEGAQFLSGGWFYYSGFAISNVLFPVLVAALFLTRKLRKVRTAVMMIFFLHVLSWLLLNAFESSHELREVKIGYYLWLASYGLLLGAHVCVCKEAGESRELVGSGPVGDGPEKMKLSN